MKSTRALAVLALFAPALATTSCLMQGADDLAGQDVELRQGAAVWDSTERPNPHYFLSPQANNKCCLTGTTGGNGDSGSCNNLCAFVPEGLITEAGVAKADDYYQATGEGTLTTLEAWKDWYGFPHRRAGESVNEFRARTNVVIYYNLTELGLGRELGCSKASNGDMGCYVTNYGASFNDRVTSLASAVTGTPIRNTVVISNRPGRASGYRIQFAAYGANGNRINKAQLDNQGARPIPAICMSCHGGSWDPDKLGTSSKYGLAKDARFLPMMTNTVLFPTSAPYRLADQETSIMKMNDFAYQTRSDALTGRQQDYLHRSYDVVSGKLAFRSGKTGQDWANGVPKNWTGKEAFYQNGVQPFCDTCHMARDTAHVTLTPADSTAGNYVPSAGLTKNIATGFTSFQTDMKNSFSAAFMGVNSSGDYTPDAWSAKPMPHSETAFARLWGDKSKTIQNCTLNGDSTHPLIDCFMVELGIWSTAAGGKLHPLVPFSSLARWDKDCGQVNVTSIASWTGTNAGRIVSPVNNFGTCIDGCHRFFSYCPGTEGTWSQEYPGSRMECAPTANELGNCTPCGEVGKPACTRIGSTCDDSYNPSCRQGLACHEGAMNGGLCTTSNLASGLTPTKTSNQWLIDLGGVKRAKEVVVNATDAASMKGAFVEYSLNNDSWLFFPDGWLDNSGVGTSKTTTLKSSKPIELRYFRVRSLNQALALSSLEVWGWTPINVGGGDIVCGTSCVNSTGALQCGGNGCSSFPGRAAKCCQGTIRAAGKACAGNPVANAPCILP